MPLTLALDEAEVLDGHTAMQRASLQIAAERAALADGLRGRACTTGSFRGVVAGVDARSVTLRAEDGGAERVLALTPARARQLLETTRK